MFEGTELAFVRLLSTKVKPAHFHANEYIVRAGDIGQEMFIIRKGLVRNFQKSTMFPSRNHKEIQLVRPYTLYVG